MDYVENVECVDIVKKALGGSKHVNVFVLQVAWSSKKTTRVGRPYTEFFDFRKALQQEFKGKADIPELPGVRSFDKGLFGSKDPKKKRKTIEDFCQSLLKLSKDISQSPKVSEFFESDKSVLRSIEIRPDSLQSLPISNDILQQLRSHAFTDGPPHTPADRLQSLEGVKPAEGTHPVLVRSSSESGEDSMSLIYIATSDYKKQRSNEADLRKGVKVEVVQKDLAGWWFVLVEETGDQGWAPGSLLEPKDPNTDSGVPAQKKGSNLYQATRSQKGVHDDEITYEAGDVVEVVEMKMDGWWRVRHQGVDGVMPAVHLEPVTEDKGKTKKIASTLYHHNSIYRKSSPPPRRESSISQLYAKVNKPPKEPDKAPVKKTAGLTYAEIAFETKPETDGSGAKMRPVILGDSSRTQYTEVLPISLPEHRRTDKATNGDTVDGGEITHKRSMSEGKRHNYMNWRGKLHSSTPYENIALDSEIPKIQSHLFEVLADHDCVSQQVDRLCVKQGNYVQADKVEASRVLCSLLDEDNAVSEIKGWVPIEKLKKIYTAGSPPGPGLPSFGAPITASQAKVKPMPTPSIKSPAPPPKSPTEPVASNAPPSDKSKKHHEAHISQSWFVGKMSRVECEELFKEHAQEKNFIIRESTYRIGHFTLSVQYSSKVHHYPIILTDEEKYYIGKHNFKNLCNVISYYQKNPLLYDEKEQPLSLGTPLIISDC